MKGRRLKRAMIHVSVAASLGLVTILFLLPAGGEVSLAQVSLSPACTLIDPLTGLCQTVTGIISPSPTSTQPSSPTPVTIPTTPPAPTTTSPAPTGSTGGTTTAGGTVKKAASKLLGQRAFGSFAYGPGGLFSGAYAAGSFGGGTTYFAPGAQTVSSHQVYFQSAFGAPVSKEVAAAAVDPATIQSAPVASAVTQVPRATLLVFPMGLLILFLVTALVLEVNEGGAGISIRRGA